MRDVLGKMRECWKYVKMRDFPHDCGTVGTMEVTAAISLTSTVSVCAVNGERHRRGHTGGYRWRVGRESGRVY